jgi:hypothetical protein
MFSEENVLAVATFHPHVDLQKVKETLQDDHLSLLDLQVLTCQRLLLSMESVADLVDLNLVDEYGAISAKLVGSKLEEQELLGLGERKKSIELHSDFG